MSARIHVNRNGETEKVVPIERISSHVGGAAPSDIILNGLPPHVFSLEFEDNAYWIQNTGNETLYVDENVIPRSSQMAWEPGEVLQVGKSLTLTLEFDGDPSPKLQRRTLLGIQPRALLTAEGKVDRDHQIKLAIVLAFTVIGILFFSFQIVVSKPDRDRTVRRELEEILSELNSQMEFLPSSVQKHSERGELKDLADALKRARVAELESQPQMAGSTYSAIRNHVRERYRIQGANFMKPIFEQVHDFAWRREQANGLGMKDSIN